MKNINVIIFLIKKRLARGMGCALIVLGLSAGQAMADYTRPDTNPPTPVDLLMVDTLSKTLVIRMLNLTPYNITQDPDYVPVDNLNSDRKSHQSMMYAPVGWPKTLPALNGTWKMDGNGLEMFVPDPASNSSLHPLNFVVTWDDQGNYVENSAIGWTIEGVDNLGHTDTQNVPLRFWFTRTKPTSKPLSALFKIISDTLFEAIHLCSVLVEPENPLAWVETFVGADELAQGSADFADENTKDGDSKMYFAAYVLPDNCPDGSTCTPGSVTTDGSDGSTDAVDVQWADSIGGGNYFSANLVVTTLLLRGEDDPTAGGIYGNQGGRVPIVSVVIMTSEDYTYSRNASASSPLTAFVSGPKLKKLLTTPDRLSGYRQFISIYRSLNRSQQRTFKKIMKYDNRPNFRQEVLIERIAEAMEKGRTKLNPETGRAFERTEKEQARFNAEDRDPSKGGANEVQ